MKKFTTLAALSTLAGAAFVGLAAPAQATEATAATPAAVSQTAAAELTAYKLSDNQLGLSSADYTFQVQADGTATATQNASGTVETLPSTTTDANGATVQLQYELTDAGEVLVNIVDPNAPEASTAGAETRAFNPAQCALGTVGGAGAGAVAGGLGGAAVGTVTLPVVGTVGAGAVGLIGGGVFGGMTGAAASCFG
ncbi:Pathogenicity island protein [Pseudoclavibacter sp. 8L]|uniref:Pathogenicity island protein n=1 Tax=Pseudoclavibacter sp. 8L TaxID=2653162 RepID=UPI0012F0FCA4|nr:Pathogenicity island protein [Pseudoclavibacter sp. 8L]VXC46689.1 conserved exported hypothetical protein [Pseudoclavibacter sp. 8L]